LNPRAAGTEGTEHLTFAAQTATLTGYRLAIGDPNRPITGGALKLSSVRRLVVSP
jgi:hypothetical protein